MTVTLGLLLSQANTRQKRGPDPRVGVVLLERTLLDPPRAAATRRWGEQVRRAYPQATLVPYTWHLVSHGPEERMRDRTTRTLDGPPHLFGGLQDTEQTRQAWEVTRLCAEALQTTTVAVRTPPSVTPGALGRARIRAFVEARRAEDLSIVWEPQGLWEASTAADLARSLGVDVLLPAFVGGRPAREDGAEGLAAPGAWLRVDGSGPRQTIHGGHVDELLDHLDQLDQLDAEGTGGTTIVFAGPRAQSNLRQVADALGQ